MKPFNSFRLFILLGILCSCETYNDKEMICLPVNMTATVVQGSETKKIIADVAQATQASFNQLSANTAQIASRTNSAWRRCLARPGWAMPRSIDCRPLLTRTGTPLLLLSHSADTFHSPGNPLAQVNSGRGFSDP